MSGICYLSIEGSQNMLNPHSLSESDPAIHSSGTVRPMQTIRTSPAVQDLLIGFFIDLSSINLVSCFQPGGEKHYISAFIISYRSRLTNRKPAHNPQIPTFVNFTSI